MKPTFKITKKHLDTIVVFSFLAVLILCCIALATGKTEVLERHDIKYYQEKAKQQESTTHREIFTRAIAEAENENFSADDLDDVIEFCKNRPCRQDFNWCESFRDSCETAFISKPKNTLHQDWNFL